MEPGKPTDEAKRDEQAAGPARRGPTGWRKWVFRLAAMTLVPAAFFLLVEGGLRLFGYGFDARFFLKVRGQDAWTTNERFAWRFFPPTGARPPVPAHFAAPRPAGTYRIFVLGGSAAMGSPEPAYGFCRLLEVMLRQRYPLVRFEVINAAMEAMNSHVARAIARECADRGADLFVVYLGNNEVVGPYGASDTFSKFSPSLPTIRASMWVRATRTGQLVGDVIRHFAQGGHVKVWKGMETFVESYVTADDSRLEKTYDHFRRNLDDIFATAREAGAAAIACTVATDLKDCPPFASRHRPGLPEADLKRWQQHYDAAKALARDGKADDAAAEFLAAAKIDDRFAELHFRLGRCHLDAGKYDDARGDFLLARDLDALRFRADRRINDVIRQAAEARQAEGIHFADTAKAFQQSPLTPHGLVGEELFHEHVHMNFQGHYVLAEAVFRRLPDILPRWVADKASGPAEPLDADTCARRLALTGWDRYKVASTVARITARAPFTNQYDHAQRQARRMAEVERLRRYTMPKACDEAVATYRQALAETPDDLLMRSNFALCLYGVGRHEEAADQWRKVLQQLPDSAEAHKNLGLVLLQRGLFDEAIEQFQTAVKLLPRDLSTRSNLGAALIWKGDSDGAVACFEEILARHPDNADAHTNLACVLAEKAQDAKAAEHFEIALRSDPAHVGAHRNFARLLSKQNKLDEAISHYRKAIEAWEDHLSHLYLGGLLERQGKTDEAMAHYRRAIALAPGFAQGHLTLGMTLLKDGKYEQAAESLTEAVRLDGNLGEAHRDLGAVLQRLGQMDRAMQHYSRAAALLPNDPVPLERLGYALLMKGQLAKAIACYRKAVALDPARAETRNNLAAALARDGQTDEAIVHFAAAVKLAPSPQRHYNLATLLSERGRDREAVVHFRQALSLRPAWPEAMEGLAWTLASARDDRVRNGAEALRLAQRACELTDYSRPAMLDALAAAQAEVGQFAQAAATARKAHDLAAAAGEKSLAEKIARRIDLYKTGKPYRGGA